ncbi:MAG: rhomboid family intramembrane serine protease [Planctomycetota bacterium]|jgi:membrane associated rhomboid family serine protease|nr:rhomboid family intramembrane serine protease [Planctomycetota bacterium]
MALPRVTPGVKLLLAINVLVFVLNALAQGALSGSSSSGWLALWWDGLWEGYGLGLVRLVTYQFTHAFVSPMHLLLNMLFLYFFGTFVEEAVGRRRLLRLYLASGLIGGILHMVVGFATGSGGWLVGASGAVYGIMMYAAILAPRMRVIFIVFPIELRWLVGVLVGIGVYHLYVQLVVSVGSQVSDSAHVGGALAGFLVHRLERSSSNLSILGGVKRRWAVRRNRELDRKQAILDELLEKVHRQGIGSLTPAEKRFLDKASAELRGRDRR